MKVDYLIVGGGLAGVNTALQCMKRGRSFMILDDSRPSSSMAAAGLVNPITGRNYVRTWHVDALWEACLRNYAIWEEILGERFLIDLDIRRVLNSIQEENKWHSRLGDERYDLYMDESWIGRSKDHGLSEDLPVVKILNAYRLRIVPLLEAVQNFLQPQGQWLNEQFDYTDWSLERKSFKHIEYQRLIFCKGAYQDDQPFEFLPLKPNLGEVLLIDIPKKHQFDYAIKKGIFICPFEKGLYWVGGTYRNVKDYAHAQPQFERLEDMLEKTLTLPHQIIERKFGIRATVPDRKPLVGVHPQHKHMGFVNGLGTKGSSLAPFCTEQLFSHWEDGHSIMPEIDLKRYL